MGNFINIVKKQLNENNEAFKELKDSFLRQIDDMIDELDDFGANPDKDIQELVDKLYEYNLDHLIDYAREGERAFKKVIKDIISYGFDDYDDEDEKEVIEDLMKDLSVNAKEVCDVIMMGNIDKTKENYLDVLKSFKTALQKL